MDARALDPKDLKLIPYPKQVECRAGTFAIQKTTRLLLHSRDAREDRVAAERLAEDLSALVGRKLKSATVRVRPKTGSTVYLARIGADRALDKELSRKGLLGAETGPYFAEEGYVLDVEPQRIVVAAHTRAGLLHGCATLHQLFSHPEPSQPERPTEVRCPALSIRDWPALRWRALQDDLSRGPLPTIDYLKRRIRMAAAYKVNLYGLYLEHVFDYAGHPLLTPREGAYSRADMAELVAYADRYGVTLLPEQQLFGHLRHWLKHERYAHLGETPHGKVLAPGSAEAREVVRSVCAELLPLFPGPFFQIGGDETWELGRGQSRARADEVGPWRVYIEHLRELVELLRPYGKTLLFWGDIAHPAHPLFAGERDPNLLALLPRELIACPWTYDPVPDFSPWLKPFVEAGFRTMATCGLWNWSVLWPRFGDSFVNIRNVARDGQRHGSVGMINTCWNDNGESLFETTWPGVLFGAACGWQAGESSIEAFWDRYDWAFYRNHDTTFRDAMAELGRTHALLAGVGTGPAHDDDFWLDPFTETGWAYVRRVLPVARELRLCAERALEALYLHRGKAHAQQSTLDAVAFAARRLDAVGLKIQLADESARVYWDAFEHTDDPVRVQRDFNDLTEFNDARLALLRDETLRIGEQLPSLWEREYHPGWLGSVLIRYQALAAIFQRKIWDVRAAARQFAETGTLPRPEQLGFFR